MTLQLRPKDAGPNAPMYAPARDLAHCFPSLARQAVYGLADIALEDWFKDYLKENLVTQEDLCTMAVAVAKAINNYADTKYKNPMEALMAAGFYDTKPVAQAAFCIKLGQAFLGAYFTAMRDVLRQEDGPPISVQKLVEDAKDLQRLMDEKAADRGTCKG